MSIIEASVYGFRMLVDGTLAITLHVDPEHRAAALALMSSPGTPVGVAALKPLHQRGEIVPPVVPPDPQKPPLGPIGQWFVARCREPAFRQWAIQHHGPDTQDTEVAVKELILERLGGLDSRTQIDWDAGAKEKALGLFIQPYKRFNERREVAA
jgi:hypothetical protein